MTATVGCCLVRAFEIYRAMHCLNVKRAATLLFLSVFLLIRTGLSYLTSGVAAGIVLMFSLFVTLATIRVRGQGMESVRDVWKGWRNARAILRELRGSGETNKSGLILRLGAILLRDHHSRLSAAECIKELSDNMYITCPFFLLCQYAVWDVYEQVYVAALECEDMETAEVYAPLTPLIVLLSLSLCVADMSCTVEAPVL